MAQAVRFEVTDGPGEEVRVQVHGELDVGGVAGLQIAADEAAARPARRVVFDLGGVEFVDSTGLAALLDAAQRVHAAGRDVATEAPPGNEARLLIQVSGTGRALGLREPA